MIKLPPIPARIDRLPKDSRGYPVPWFVCWMQNGKPCQSGKGEPDFRIIHPGKLAAAVSQVRCWICGVALGRYRVYAIGPMCVVNRVTSEPPSHRECAEFAVTACPFLINPRQKRSEKGLPEGRFVAGIHIDRNPGAVALYETRSAERFKAGDGYLFQLGKPDRIDWYAEGRRAKRAEVEASIASGYPLLREAAEVDGADAIMELEAMREQAMGLLPA